jgi:hypothetical protein
MAKQQMPTSLGGAGLSLLIALSGGLVVLLTEVGSWPAVVLLLGLAAVLTGVVGLCVYVYRHSRSTGAGVLRSLGHAVSAAVRLIADLVP